MQSETDEDVQLIKVDELFNVIVGEDTNLHTLLCIDSVLHERIICLLFVCYLFHRVISFRVLVMGRSGKKKVAQLKRNILRTNISGKGTSADFKRKKSKVGKQNLRAKNATSVSFKSKRVQLTSQSILVERDGATILSSKGKTLAELHRLLKHPTPKVVCEAVAEVRCMKYEIVWESKEKFN